MLKIAAHTSLRGQLKLVEGRRPFTLDPHHLPAPSCSVTSSAAAHPAAFDRWLATRFGLQAVTAVREKDFGNIVALRGTHIIRVPLIEGTGELELLTSGITASCHQEFGHALRNRELGADLRDLDARFCHAVCGS